MMRHAICFLASLGRMESRVPKLQHTAGEIVREMERLRVGAAEIVNQAFPVRRKLPVGIPGLHRTGVSRARAGCTSNPLYRLAMWFLVLSYEECLLLIRWLLDQVRLIRPAARASVHELSLREQVIEGQENNFQLAYTGGDLGARADWIRALRAERAVIDELLVALEAEEAGSQQLTAVAA